MDRNYYEIEKSRSHVVQEFKQNRKSVEAGQMELSPDGKRLGLRDGDSR